MAFVSLCCNRNINDAISIRKNAFLVGHFYFISNWAFFPVEMTSFMFLPQHRDT